MRYFRLLVLAPAVCCINLLLGQQDLTGKTKRVKLTDFTLLSGSLIEGSLPGTYGDFQTLAPNSQLLKLGADWQSASSFDVFGDSRNAMLAVLVGLDFKDKDLNAYKTNPHLRLGITYISSTGLEGELFNEVSAITDTLVSAQTGQTFYTSTVKTDHYRMQYTSQQVRLDASLLFRTNPEARWSLFAGVGLSVGVSMNASTEISFYQSERTEFDVPTGGSATYTNTMFRNNSVEETFRNKTGVGLMPYVPMGIDFRLGKEREFWKRLHLFYEIRPGINVQSIPELRTVAHPALQQGMGLRVTW